MAEGDEGRDRDREGRSISVRLKGERLERFEELEEQEGSCADALRELLDRVEELENELEQTNEDLEAWREVAQNLSEKL
jgi:predicted  nucleic acid-binding Zn-ribbon protein